VLFRRPLDWLCVGWLLCPLQWGKCVPGGGLVVKSGTDFRELSEVVLHALPATMESPHHYAQHGRSPYALDNTGPRFR
jgi:hypothetical protein